MKAASDIVKYLGTFVAMLLVIVSIASLYNALNYKIAIFEGVAIALLCVVIILLLTLYYKVDQMAVPKKRR
ncbi:MAG: hypothetical protein HYS81_04425 [Candidatus Aenigmatarchaeota archaeon]|nr:MAG: hypothetical protein HYS81_04425 [Candidatus Aenigmarchaeota archaeon]